MASVNMGELDEDLWLYFCGVVCSQEGEKGQTSSWGQVFENESISGFGVKYEYDERVRGFG
jgi:hypothetical protein